MRRSIVDNPTPSGDFRRTAAGNLQRAGVPRSVAMKTNGHRTEAVYRRYTIPSNANLRDATARLGTFLGTPRGVRLKPVE
jgi:hypothetical protein